MLLTTATSAGGAGTTQQAAPRFLSPSSYRGPVCSTDEQIGDLALGYAYRVLRHVPLRQLRNPHYTVSIKNTPPFTVFEVLAELRHLPWFEAGTDPGPSNLETQATEAGKRLKFQRDAHGQLTLQTLYNCGTQPAPGSRLLARSMARDGRLIAAMPSVPRPSARDPIRLWMDWIGDQSRAGASDPSKTALTPLICTLDDLTRHVANMAPGRPFYNLALSALTEGRLLPGALKGISGFRPFWTAGRFCAVLSSVEASVRNFAALRQANPQRQVSQQALIQRTTIVNGFETPQAQDDAVYEVYETLQKYTPDLLDCVAADQGADAANPLPGLLEGPDAFCPALEGKILIAAAMATVLKCFFRLDNDWIDAEVLDDLDAMVGNVALACVTAGIKTPSQAHYDVRLAEALALQHIEGMLQIFDKAATLRLRNFDGDTVEMRARRRKTGRLFVTMWKDGAAVPLSFAQFDPFASRSGS